MTRWTRRLLIGAIAILVPTLAGCEAGLNAPTLEFHPASYGVSTVVNGITFDDLFVLGPALNETLPAGGQTGVFLSLSSQFSNDKLVAVSAPGTASSVQLATGPITLVQGTVVDLSGPHPEIVLNGLTNPLNGGETVRLTFTFTNAGAVTLMVPVEPAAYEFATYFPPPTPTASTAAHRHKARSRVKVTADLAPTPSPVATP